MYIYRQTYNVGYTKSVIVCMYTTPKQLLTSK